MRKIKFKYYYENIFRKEIITKIRDIDEIENIKFDIINLENSHLKLLDKCLFTGLKDKNSKEIYEGDIVNYEDNEHYGIVAFKKGAFGVDYYNFDISDCPLFYTFYELIHNKKQLLVVGNIYEHSTLIKRINYE